MWSQAKYLEQAWAQHLRDGGNAHGLASFHQKCHEIQIEEWVTRGDGFSAVSVKFFDRFWSLPIPAVAMHLSQDILGCTGGLYALPSEHVESRNI